MSTEIEKELERLSSRIQELHKSIFGNGHGGLKSDIYALRARLQALTWAATTCAALLLAELAQRVFSS